MPRGVRSLASRANHLRFQSALVRLLRNRREHGNADNSCAKQASLKAPRPHSERRSTHEAVKQTADCCPKYTQGQDQVLTSSLSSTQLGMRSVLASVGRRVTSHSAPCAPGCMVSCRLESTGRATCFGDVFDSDATVKSQPHIAPEHGVPDSIEGNTYLQEVRGPHVVLTSSMT